MRTYEAMFVLDDAKCTENFDAVAAQVKDLLVRNRAEVLACEKWDQRRLCYPVKHHNRATYLLVHFNADEDSVTPIRAACRLSPVILRSLILVDRDGIAAPPPQAPEEEAPTRSRAPAAPEETVPPDVEEAINEESDEPSKA